MWQVGPAGRTRSRIASPSQSSRSSSTRACCRTSRPCARAARASGSRTRPHRSRASAAAPPRPSRRASARGRCPRPGRSPASDPDVPSRLASAPPSAPAAARGRSCTIEATIAASAPAAKASARCRASPAPPDAITGTLDRSGDGARQLEVVAGSRPVGVDRGDEQLAGAALDGLARPLDGVSTARLAAAVGDDLASARVDRADHGLRAELVREPRDQPRARRPPRG